MDSYKDRIAQARQIADDFTCFQVHFPTLAGYSYGAWLRKIGLYRRLRAVYDAIGEAGLDIHHGHVLREKPYHQEGTKLPVEDYVLDLSTDVLVLRFKRQSHDWIVAFEINDVEDKGKLFVQNNGSVFALKVDADAAYDPAELINPNSCREGFHFQSAISFAGEPDVAEPTDEVRDVMFENRAKWLNWLVNDLEHVECVLKDNAEEAAV